MKTKTFEKLRDIINSFYKLNGDVTVDNMIYIIVPISYLILNDRGDIKASPELLEYAKAKAKDDFFQIIDNIKETLETLFSEDIKDLLILTLNKNYGNKGDADHTITTSDLCDLIYRLLDIKDGDKLYDLGSGYGSVLANIYNYAIEDDKHIVSLYGQELNQNAADISRLVVEIFTGGEIETTIKCEDALSSSDFKYNKAYAFSPVGQYQTLRSTNHQSLLYPDMQLNESYHEQWIYIDRMLAGLEGDDARAIALVYTKTLSQTDENLYLQRLLDDGWIEGLIELPMCALNNSGAYISFIVFSKGNKEVRSIWADDVLFYPYVIDYKEYCYHKNNLDVNGIMKVYRGDAKAQKSRTVTFEQLKLLNDWWPTSQPLLTKEDKKGKYIPLEQVGDAFFCTQYTANDFIVSQRKTEQRILTAKDIDEYGINWGSTKFIEPPTKINLAKSEIFNGDLIITNKSTKAKIAAVTDKPEEHVYAVGGMVIVRADQGKVDPTYLKMFFESEEGQQILNKTSTGSEILAFSVSMIRNIGIPYLEYDKQVDKAKKYNEKLASIRKKQKEIDKLSHDLKKIYLEED